MTYSILLIALPLLMAFLSILIKRPKHHFLYLGLVLNLGILLVLDKGYYLIGGYDKGLGISLVLDQYGYLAVWIVNGLFVLGVLANRHKIEAYATIILTLLAGVNGMVLTGDLFNLFVFIEVTSISVFILTTSSKKLLATFNYIIIATLGSSLYLIGIMILYSQFGTLDIQLMGQMARSSDLNLFIPMIFIFLGLGVEVKLIPLNGWVKGIYARANGLVLTLMGASVASAGLLVMGRILNEVLIGQTGVISLVVTLACLTLVGGEIAAFNGKTIKEVLLYSSIGQAGLICLLMAFGLVFPALVLVINNGLAKLVLFSVGDIIQKDNQAYRNQRGWFSNHQGLGLAFTVASLSLVGLPLFMGFYGKINGLVGLFNEGLGWVVLIALVTIIEGAYMIKLNICLWHPGQEGQEVTQFPVDSSRVSKGTLVTSLAISLVILVLGVFPSWLGQVISVEDLDYETETQYLIDLKGGNE